MANDLEVRDKFLASLSSPIVNALSKRGMTIEKWIEGLCKLTEAEQEKPFKGSKDQVVYSKPLPNHEVQLKAHEVIGRTAGWITEHVEVEGEVVHYTPDQVDAIRKVAKMVAEKMRAGELK